MKVSEFVYTPAMRRSIAKIKEIDASMTWENLAVAEILKNENLTVSEITEAIRNINHKNIV